MPIVPASLSAAYNTDTGRVLIEVMLPPPALPPQAAAMDEYYIYARTGRTYNFEVAAKQSNVEEPSFIYAVPGSDPVQRFLVRQVNGVWNWPGTPYTGS